MIYQLFYKPEHRADLFQNDPYKPFGLEPEVNSELLKNCDELTSHKDRLQLVEYGAFLWHWRNDTQDPWIGFTSHRQKDKTTFSFSSSDEVSKLLSEHDIVGWGKYGLLDRKGFPITLAKQAEVCHPGLNQFISEVFSRFDKKVPMRWFEDNFGFFANYWVMPKDMFHEFMEYSWPMVKWSVENITSSDYYRTQNSYGTVSREKCVGYFLERLFILWYLEKDLNPYCPTNPFPLFHNT